MLGEALVHPGHDEGVDRAVGVIIVLEEERSRHGVELLRVHGEVAEAHDRAVERAERNLFGKRGLVAELACGVDLDLDLAARALGDVLRELKRGLVVGVRDGRGVGEADRLGGEVGGTGDGARKGGRDGHGGGLDEVGHCVGSRCCLS